MKLIHILVLVFTSLFFSNCSDSKEDSVPPYLYTFHLKFVDADNINILENLNISFLKNNFSLDSFSEKDVEKLEVLVESIGNVLYLKVSATSNPSQRLEKIYFNVISKEIFNDDESHQIKTVWKWKNKLDNTPTEVSLDDNNLKSEVVTPTFQYFLVEL